MRFLTFCLLCSVLLSACGDDELSPAEQLQNDIALIENYLDDNNITYESDVSGLRYVIHEQGDGGAPNANSTVRVAYEGRFLTDQQVFDSSDDISFSLRNVIVGWQIGIPLVNEGGRITLYIPSGLAYGRAGIRGIIPANANLIFDVDLFEIQ